jgi:hypothetical protein
MTLEQQVCSLELAKRLKELGVTQESYLYWTEKEYPSDGYGVIPWEFYWCGCDSEEGSHGGCDLREIAAEREGGPGKYDPEAAYSAFTVADLGEMLPPESTEHVKVAKSIDYPELVKGARHKE